jgi:hypothetical protein
MKAINISIEKFEEQFDKEYDFLYENKDNVSGYREALACFDDLLKSNKSFKKFVIEFVKYRKDYIASDREAVAFMFALEVLE